MKLFVFTFLSIIYHCHAYSSGAPELVCDDMTPKHPFSPQETKLPFKVSVNKDQVKAGDTVELQVGGGSYKGLLVEVRNSDKKAVGQFIVPDNDRYFKTINCHGNKNNALTHKNSEDKNNLKIVWKAPNTTGKFTVYVTVARDGETFWAAIPTQVITVF